MKNLESILKGVTPPETWNVRHYTEPTGKCYELAIGCREAPRLSPVARINFPDKIDEANAALILRAVRNFAPLVRALDGLRDACKDVLLPTINDAIKQGYKMSTWTPEQMQWAKAVEDTEKALAQALADEP